MLAAVANRTPMASIDAAWLGMEDPTNLMMVTGVMALDGRVDLKRLRLVLDRRLMPFGRFHQRVVRPRSRGSLPHWEDDGHFDIDNHVSHVALPAPGGDDALREMVSGLMSVPLDFTKPLWHMHVIDNYHDGSVVLTRVHHCIADGIALVRVMLSLTDASPDATPVARPPPRPLPAGATAGPARRSGDCFQRQARPAQTRRLVGAGATRRFQVDRQSLRRDSE